jgi:hypothetical protein
MEAGDDVLYQAAVGPGAVDFVYDTLVRSKTAKIYERSHTGTLCYRISYYSGPMATSALRAEPRTRADLGQYKSARSSK